MYLTNNKYPGEVFIKRMKVHYAFNTTYTALKWIINNQFPFHQCVMDKKCNYSDL
jgi:hypothetical protein